MFDLRVLVYVYITKYQQNYIIIEKIWNSVSWSRCEGQGVIPLNPLPLHYSNNFILKVKGKGDRFIVLYQVLDSGVPTTLITVIQDFGMGHRIQDGTIWCFTNKIFEFLAQNDSLSNFDNHDGR